MANRRRSLRDVGRHTAALPGVAALYWGIEAVAARSDIKL